MAKAKEEKSVLKYSSQKEVDEKVVELEIQAELIGKNLGGIKVTPLFFCIDGNTEVIGFVKEPSLEIKMDAMDLFQAGKFMMAGQMLLLNCLLPEVSDKKILSRLPEDENYYLGAVQYMQGTVKLAVNYAKKN